MSRPLEHPSDETLLALACRDLGPRESRQALEHIASCPECAALWEAVEMLRRGAGAFDPGVIDQGAPHRGVDDRLAAGRGRDEARLSKASPWKVAAAVTLLTAAPLALSLVFTERSEFSSQSDEVPVRSEASVEIELLEPAEGAKVVDPRFCWTRINHTDEYSLEILGSDGDLVWASGRLTGPCEAWPESVEAQPGRYYWRVIAHSDGGWNSTASSLVAFEVAQ